MNVDGGYRLAVEPNQIDVYVALEATAASKRLLDEAEERQVIDLCASTLSHFTGDLADQRRPSVVGGAAPGAAGGGAAAAARDGARPGCAWAGRAR